MTYNNNPSSYPSKPRKEEGDLSLKKKEAGEIVKGKILVLFLMVDPPNPVRPELSRGNQIGFELDG